LIVNLAAIVSPDNYDDDCDDYCDIFVNCRKLIVSHIYDDNEAETKANWSREITNVRFKC